MAIFEHGNLQGSVATQLTYGEMFNNDYIANLLVTLAVKNKIRLAFGKVMDKKSSVQYCFFLVHSVHCVPKECHTFGMV